MKAKQPAPKRKVKHTTGSTAACHQRPCSPPNVLWLQFHGDSDPCDESPIDDADATWCRDKIFEADVEYVSAKEVRELLSALDECLMIPANVLPAMNALEVILSAND